MAGARDELAALRRHRVPAWWRDAKLGILVHWTPASVPAFAPTDVTLGDLLASEDPAAFARMPYTEWYENSLRFPDSPVARHHAATYGNRPYATFARDWEAALEQWDPDAWAARFAATGAGHVVLVAKHADGYCLWPTDVTNPHRSDWASRRDVVGELAEAVRGAGMRFGVYYCGGWDWTFDPRPVGTMAETLAAVPQGAYPAYADAQVRELVRRYRPSVLWNDVAWPGRATSLRALVGDYYRAVPDGLINDRWMPWSPLAASLVGRRPVARLVDALSRRQARDAGGLLPPKPPHFDVRTPEYTAFDRIEHEPWECVRGMDASFGYNRASGADDYLGRDELLSLFTDVVARGGNLLLNVGPRGEDAQLPDEHVQRLDWLAAWFGPHRDAIAATDPWVAAGGTTAEGQPVRYTARGETVHAIVTGASGTTTLAEVAPTAATSVRTLAGERLPWHDSPQGLVVEVPPVAGVDGADRSPDIPVVVALHAVTARPVR